MANNLKVYDSRLNERNKGEMIIARATMKCKSIDFYFAPIVAVLQCFHKQTFAVQYMRKQAVAINCFNHLTTHLQFSAAFLIFKALCSLQSSFAIRLTRNFYPPFQLRSLILVDLLANRIFTANIITNNINSFNLCNIVISLFSTFYVLFQFSQEL